MARSRQVSVLLGVLASLALLPPAASQAASLHIPDAHVTVAQGGSASFQISLTASGALTCSSSATVNVDSSYAVDPSGKVTSAGASGVTFSASAARGSGHNCEPTWDGAPSPYALAATASADSATPLGDYTAPIHYEVQNSGKGPAGKLSNAGTVNVTIHVVAATAVQPDQTVSDVTAPDVQLVLDDRVLAPRPSFGKTELLALVSGKVSYRTPGGKVTKLSDAVIVPNGTMVDATDGVAKVTVEHSPDGRLDNARAWAGAFSTRQDDKGTTIFTLTGRLVAGSHKGASAARVQAAKAKHRPHLLWVDAKGNFKTRGNHASAIARGTVWLTQDTRAATTVRVKHGAVAVRDFAHHRTVLVTAGHSYTARPRTATARRVPAFTGRAL